VKDHCNKPKSLRKDEKHTQRICTKKNDDITDTFVEVKHEQELLVTEAEIGRALSNMKNNKADGSNNLPLLKSSRVKRIRTLTALYQRIWETGIWPEDWKRLSISR